MANTNRNISFTAPSSSSMTNIGDILSPVVMFKWIEAKIKSLSENKSSRYIAQALERQSANVLQLMVKAFESEADDIAQLHLGYIRTHLHTWGGQSQQNQEDFLLISYQLLELIDDVITWKVEKKKRALRQRQKSDEEENKNRKYNNLNSALIKMNDENSKEDLDDQPRNSQQQQSKLKQELVEQPEMIQLDDDEHSESDDSNSSEGQQQKTTADDNDGNSNGDGGVASLPRTPSDSSIKYKKWKKQKEPELLLAPRLMRRRQSHN